MKQAQHSSKAFTLIELLIVVAILGVLVLIQIPAFAYSQAGVQRLYCIGNLKNVGVAFRTWAGRNSGLMPMAVPASSGGASSAVGIAATGFSMSANWPFSGPYGVFGMFAVMSNELTTPKILYCPSEYRSTIVQGSIFGNSTATNQGFFSDNGTSYFVGVDASDTAPQMFLTGDHHLGDGATPPSYPNLFGDSRPKFVSAGTNTAWGSTGIGWANAQHGLKGNVCFADGSVQTLDTTQLRISLNRTGDTGRFASTFNNAVGSLGTGVNRLQFP